MDDSKDEQWKTLCVEASMEKDPETLLALITEINRLLEEKRSQTA